MFNDLASLFRPFAKHSYFFVEFVVTLLFPIVAFVHDIT